MTIAIALIALGAITQAVVLVTSHRVPLPRFTQVCPTCSYQIPPMERPPAFHDCPECDRLFSSSDRPLHQ